jgi:hypothetical protein
MGKEMASQGSENWKDIELWLQEVHILQDSLKPYDINEFFSTTSALERRSHPGLGSGIWKALSK